MKEHPSSDLCAQGKHEWCMNRSPAESHCQCPCHKSSKNGNDLPARLRQLSGIMGGGASHHLNKAALEAADVIDRQRATIEFVNKQIRSVTPDWNAVVRWLDDSLALYGRADETTEQSAIRAAQLALLAIEVTTARGGIHENRAIYEVAQEGLGRRAEKATTPREPPAATTFELNQDRSGCKHCGMLHGHHIVEDEYGRRDVCQRRAQNGTTR